MDSLTFLQLLSIKKRLEEVDDVLCREFRVFNMREVPAILESRELNVLPLNPEGLINFKSGLNQGQDIILSVDHLHGAIEQVELIRDIPVEFGAAPHEIVVAST